MTVICTDGASVCADTLMTLGTERQLGHSKLRAAKSRSGASAILAVSGSAAVVDALAAWWSAGAKPGDAPKLGPDASWTLLVVTTGGMSFYSDRVPYPLSVAPPFAMGSGGDYALGAMKHGASPKRACEIACELDTSCGGPIETMDLMEMELPKTRVAGINARTGKQVIRLERAS